METILVGIISLIVGLINPNWVLFGNINKTRGKVIAVYGFVFIFAFVVQIIGSPNSFETGKKAFLEKNYDYAITKLENIESTDKNYTEAQALLKQARTLLWPSKFEKAKIAASNQQYSQVISLLSDYPADEKGFAEASKLLKYAEEKLEEEQHQKQVDQEAQKIESEHIEEIKSAEKERKKALVDYSKVLGTKILVLEKEIYEAAGEEFNINSPKQLGVILFEKLGMPNGKKTKSGYSTAADVLEKLAPDYPVVSKILEYRQLSKLKSTYADGLTQYISEDGRIHGTFNQTITATGRISSTEPNLQNIPIKYEMGREIRKMFTPEEKGDILLSCDYSQIELRVLASVSKDENLITAYNNDLDLHDLTARKIFAVKDEEEVTREMRSVAKIVNFSIIYGKTAFGLAKELGISQSDAKLYIERYFAEYPKVKELETKIIEDAEKKGYVETIYGRKRSIPELKSNNKNLRNAGERMAVNTVIQGSAADILKIVMVKLYEELKGNEEIFMNLQVHDELVFEIRNDKIDFYMEKIKHTMESSVVLPDVKLKVNGAYGNNWSETK